MCYGIKHRLIYVKIYNMNSVRNYFWKYSSPAHIILLIAIAIVLVLFGKKLLGSEYTVMYPLAAVIIAGIEMLAINTKPKNFNKK